MPKTTVQQIIFGLLMSYFMAFGMEIYNTAINSGVTVKVQQSDSSTGMTSAIEGLCDIGMASREVKDSEKEQGLDVTTICMDGIAVVVNNDNTVDNLSLEQIRQIFTGEVTDWSAVK